MILQLPTPVEIIPGVSTQPPSVNPNVNTQIPVGTPVVIPGTSQISVTNPASPAVSTPFQVHLFPSSSQVIVSTGQPTSVLVAPFQGPDNTVAATSVSQMFSIATSSAATWNFVYNVGIPATYSIWAVAIRNNTNEHNLQITVNPPPYMYTDLPLVPLQTPVAPPTIPSVTGILQPIQPANTNLQGTLNEVPPTAGFMAGARFFILNAGDTQQFNVGFYEPGTMALSAAQNGILSIPFIFQITPLLVNGPVWVYTNMPALSVT